MEVIDLTKELDENIDVYPGDPPVEIKRWSSIDTNGYNVHRVCLGTHTGTHIDAPSHMLKDGATLSDINIEKLVGYLVKLAFNKVRIDTSDLKFVIDRIKDDSIVLFDVPAGGYLTKDAAKFLISRVKIKSVCFGDGALIDSKEQTDFPVHKVFLKENIPIITNLVNVNKVHDGDFIVIAPLKLKNMDGAPCRVFVIR